MTSVPLPLPSDEAHSWCVGLDASPSTCARLHATLTEDEQRRSARLRSERDRRRFIVAHGALRELLGRYLGARPGDIRFVHNAHGKPALHPDWGGRLKFNLSHAGGYALIAITAGAEIGVDLEYVRPLPDQDAIARCFFSAAEVDRLRRMPRERQALAFFNCWTRKEAFVKARGEGLDADASEAMAPAPGWSLFTLQPAPGYVGALVVEGLGRRLRQRRWQATADASDAALLSRSRAQLAC